MGFDPRNPSSGRTSPRHAVTSNVDTLLAENDALRREVRRLRQLLQELQIGQRQPGGSVSGAGRHGITAAQVERWGVAMARHPRWQALRVGPPGGLRGLVEQRRRRSWTPQLSLEEELEHRAPGLGAELAEALRGPHSRVRWAVRAAFALHGQRAPEWLSEAPLRLVDDLLRLVPGPRGGGRRSENHSQGPGDSASHAAGGSGNSAASTGGSTSAGSTASSGGSASSTSSGGSAGSGGSDSDPRSAALQLLGLERGASLEAIKRAYRRLAKHHHPDLGGDVDLFHRLDAAYRLLIG